MNGLGMIASRMQALQERAEKAEAKVQEQAAAVQFDVEWACEVMHSAYAIAVAKDGWETQPWADVPEAHKVRMRAAVTAFRAALGGEQS